MLAPRKVLWSTPEEAVRRASELVPLSDSDTVVDVGCGDGRVLLEWAKLHYALSSSAAEGNETAESASSSEPRRLTTFVGIDTDPERIQTAERAWQKAVQAGQIDPMKVSSQFHCANAISTEGCSLWVKTANVLYLYLTPHGLRRLRPLLDDCPNVRNVVSYMNPLPDVPTAVAEPPRRKRITVPHQPEAAWPLYVYKFAAR